ncbi:glycosyltransferase family 4 protein [Nostocoides veronense]|uniref:D-inositol 3-phosphate glycosyltransferase n=1 Tax=Nostocoides veronense TaxID=330836 RepID=A0ABN2L975_9MICO
MRVGLVCPYSFDVPGGVQFHVRDLAEWLAAHGHAAQVLAPADDDADLPPYLTSCGRAIPVRYNGSVARLTFGPVTAARVNRWLADGDFDVLHLHEPMTPSASVLALWAFDGPIVATFHTATLRSRAMSAAYPLLRPSLEKISGRIAVSEAARRTVIRHIGGDAVVIPNGVDVAAFAGARPEPAWCGRPGAPTIGFLGRIDEPRKGLAVLSAAMEQVLGRMPGARLVVAGPGDASAAREAMSPTVAAASEFLGPLSDADKARFLHSVDLYVAPNTGGESFGIILVEAMAAGAPVLASDLPAFLRVLGEGAGASFTNEDSGALASEILRLLDNDGLRVALAAAASVRARDFDWSIVANDILAVYDTVTPPGLRSRAWN